MNMPSSAGDNWSWRCPEGVLTSEIAHKLAAIAEVADRDIPPKPYFPTITTAAGTERGVSSHFAGAWALLADRRSTRISGRPHKSHSDFRSPYASFRRSHSHDELC